MKKLLSMALVLVMILSSLSMFATGAFAAADKWDGKTANIKWYADNTSANEFTVTTAADLFGLSVICFSVDSNACVYNGDKKVYYEDNGNVIFDATKITAETKNVPSFR